MTEIVPETRDSLNNEKVQQNKDPNGSRSNIHPDRLKLLETPKKKKEKPKRKPVSTEPPPAPGYCELTGPPVDPNETDFHKKSVKKEDKDYIRIDKGPSGFRSKKEIHQELLDNFNENHKNFKVVYDLIDPTVVIGYEVSGHPMGSTKKWLNLKKTLHEKKIKAIKYINKLDAAERPVYMEKKYDTMGGKIKRRLNGFSVKTKDNKNEYFINKCLSVKINYAAAFRFYQKEYLGIEPEAPEIVVENDPTKKFKDVCIQVNTIPRERLQKIMYVKPEKRKESKYPPGQKNLMKYSKEGRELMKKIKEERSKCVL
jgi:hypothetical protein